MKLPFQRVRSVSRGQSMVELALVLPLLVLMMLIAIDFGRIYFSYIQINNAAREGAKYAASAPSNTALITTAASRETNAQAQSGESALVLSAPVCKNAGGTVISCATATTGGSGPGNTVTVRVAESFSFLTPIINNFWGNNFQMTASATSTIYGFVASEGGTPPGSCAATDSRLLVQRRQLADHLGGSQHVRPRTAACATSPGTTGPGAMATTTLARPVAAPTPTVPPAPTPWSWKSRTRAAPRRSSATLPSRRRPPHRPAPSRSPTSIGRVPARRIRITISRRWPIRPTARSRTGCGRSPTWAWCPMRQAPAPQTYGNNSSHPVTLQVTNAGGTSTITLSG